MIVLIDNYDSFSYNVYQLAGAVFDEIRVVRNDACTVEQIRQMDPQGILLSPGPGKPSQAGICIELVQALYDTIPILGICLGHQAICEAFGGKVSYARELMHGKQDMIQVIKEDPIFRQISPSFPAARYHSLAIRKLPECLETLALAKDDEIMAIRHKEHLVYGFQFHPESVMTRDGLQMIKNFKLITGGSKHDQRSDCKNCK